MSQLAAIRTDLYYGIFQWERHPDGDIQLTRRASAPSSMPDPQNGRLLKIATIDARSRAICPSCSTTAHGGFVSFVQDLRLAYACPNR